MITNQFFSQAPTNHLAMWIFLMLELQVQKLAHNSVGRRAEKQVGMGRGRGRTRIQDSLGGGMGSTGAIECGVPPKSYSAKAGPKWAQRALV